MLPSFTHDIGPVHVQLMKGFWDTESELELGTLSGFQNIPIVPIYFFSPKTLYSIAHEYTIVHLYFFLSHYLMFSQESQLLGFINNFKSLYHHKLQMKHYAA